MVLKILRILAPLITRSRVKLNVMIDLKSPIIDTNTKKKSKVFYSDLKYCEKPSPTIFMKASSTKIAMKTVFIISNAFLYQSGEL
jgi:hypothetical protein